ncbi:MAG: ABC transporter ATP-binding protein [Bacilli bacterium]|nr:ABC transporter ATP-binding protein [Bacilli bacterium]
MIKRYYKIVKKYFSLKADSKKCLFHIFLSALLKIIMMAILPFLAAKIVGSATAKDFQLAFFDTLIFLGCSLLYVLCHHYNYVAYQNHAVYTHNKLQKLILEKVTAFDEDFTKSIKTSFIVNTSFQDVGEVMQIPDQIVDVLNYLLSIIISLVVLFTVSIYMGGIAFVMFLISFFSLSRNLKWRDYYLLGQRKHQDDISELMGQVLEGNKEVQSFNMKNDLDQYLENYKKSWRKDYFKKRKYNDYAEVVSPMILGIGKLMVYFIAIYLILHGEYEISMLVLVVGYYEEIESKFERLYDKLHRISANSTRVDRIYKLLHYKNKNMLSYGDYDEDHISGKITFEKVYFTYEKQQILKNITFSIKPNSFTAIVGKSGSGKSTIFRLLLRLYKSDSGSILLDDVNIYDYSREVYSSNVSIVTQKPFIFDMSIRDNLNLVDSNRENQIKACKRAGVHNFIESLPDGYNTKLVRDAENISGGQKQLIALARTLLSKSEVLLFDEVTSSLDMNTSKKVMEILKDLKKDHTILMITHKPSLMKLADEIIVIDKGRLVAKSTHRKLLKECSEYQVLQK